MSNRHHPLVSKISTPRSSTSSSASSDDLPSHKSKRKPHKTSLFGDVRASTPVQKLSSFFGSVASAVAITPLTPPSSEQPPPGGLVSIDEFYSSRDHPSYSPVSMQSYSHDRSVSIDSGSSSNPQTQRDLLQDKSLPRVPNKKKCILLEPISLPEIPQLGSIVWSPVAGNSSLADALLLPPPSGSNYYHSLSPDTQKPSKRDSLSKDLLSRRTSNLFNYNPRRRSSLGSITSVQLLEADINYLNWLKRLSQENGAEKRLSASIKAQALSNTFEQHRRSLLLIDRRISMGSSQTIIEEHFSPVSHSAALTHGGIESLQSSLASLVPDMDRLFPNENIEPEPSDVVIEGKISTDSLEFVDKPLPLPNSSPLISHDLGSFGLSLDSTATKHVELKMMSPFGSTSPSRGLRKSPRPKRDTLLFDTTESRSPRLSSKKAASILGESCPVDLSPAQALKSLQLLLSSHLPLCFLLLHLLRDQSIELLYFLLDAQDFEQTEFESSDDLYQAAQDMFAVYMLRDAPLEINVTYQAKRTTADGIRSRSVYCFSKAMEEIMSLLEDSFRFFKMSPLAKEMIAFLGRHQVYHPNEDVLRVVDMIRTCLVKDAPHDDFRAQQNMAAIRSRTEIFLQEYIAPFFGLDL